MTSETLAIGAIIGAIGALPFIAAATNWDLFFNHRKAQRFVKIFGRNGARAFYAILGVVVMAFAVCMVFNVFGLDTGP